jgi:transcription antitermination factor NusG
MENGVRLRKVVLMHQPGGAMEDLLSGGATYLSGMGEAVTQSGKTLVGFAGRNETDDPRVHWYAVQTYSRHEKRVCEYLSHLDVECFLPLYETVHRWRNGCKARVELPLFPNYLFVKTDPRERFRILEIPGTLSFVGSSNELWPLPTFEIESLRSSLHLRKYEPHDYLVVGQKVRIIAGPLSGLAGILVQKRGEPRVVLSLELIQRSVAVEVDAGDVEVIRPVASHLV